MTGSIKQAAMATLALVGAILILAWLSPQALGAPQKGESPPGRLSGSEMRTLQEKAAKLDRASGTGASAQRRIDEDAAGNPYFAGELVVTYEEGTSTPVERTVREESNGQVEEKLPEIDASVLSFPGVQGKPSGEAREDALRLKKQQLQADPAVEAVDYNYLARKLAVPNDPLFGQQWGLQRIQAPRAWEGSLGRNAAIAIIDGGAQATHADLYGAFVEQWDYWGGDSTPNDEDGHGTHVSGIAAAYTNNSRGVSGVAPMAPLFNYDVCGATSCPYSHIAEAIMDATDLGADVINMSLGGGAGSTSLENAVNYAWNHGVVVVAAAGNDATSAPSYPAAYPNVIAVSGTDYYNGDSGFSNYGSWVDVAAPGGDDNAFYGQRILSSVPSYIQSSGYDSWNGTSMASPFVAGVAALLDSKGLTAPQIRQRIEATATDLGLSGKDIFFGHGLVNARAAVGPPSDATAPRGTLLVNGGAASTASRAVTLTFRANDPWPGTGVASMRIRDAGGAWSSWQPYARSKSWTLVGGAGTRTVYAQYRDRAGNVSAAVYDNITYRP